MSTGSTTAGAAAAAAHNPEAAAAAAATAMEHQSTNTNTNTKTNTSTSDAKNSPKTSNSNSEEDARYYSYNPELLQQFVSQEPKPWMDPNNPNAAKHFQNVAISPSAIMKMMMHCDSGVQKGIRQNGNPIEVMGLLLGRPDPDPNSNKNTLIVTDAFPLPIEGFETRVIADDQAVVNHMISLNECLELSRHEKFMGWYHSHPFDLTSDGHSHCFLSQTDLSTQLQWQRAEDPHGNPFVALVVDPLLSAHVGSPQLKAFRAFPPEYTSPILNQCPDGSIEAREQVRLEHWGSCWNRYYELSVQYYMSSTSRNVLSNLTQNYLWMTNWKRSSNNSNEGDQDQALQQVASACAGSASMAAATTASTEAEGFQFGTGSSSSARGGGPRMGAGSATNTNTNLTRQVWLPALGKLSQLATHELSNNTLQQVQANVFPNKSINSTSDGSGN